MSQLTQLDANQVIKTVYDPLSQALSMVPAHVASTTLLNAVSGGVSITSSAVNILAFKVMGVMVTWTGLDHTDGTLQFQGSIDGTTYTNIGSATTLSSASGAQDFGLIDEPYAFIRLAYVHGTNTTGSVTAVYMLRA